MAVVVVIVGHYGLNYYSIIDPSPGGNCVSRMQVKIGGWLMLISGVVQISSVSLVEVGKN